MSIHKEDKERTDQAYLEWKGWKERDAKRMEDDEKRRSEAAKKTEHWALYRECTKLLEANKTKWMERQEDEKMKKLEEEKQPI